LLTIQSGDSQHRPDAIANSQIGSIRRPVINALILKFNVKRTTGPAGHRRARFPLAKFQTTT
jgi:hypothetical protein